ncbi:MAG TPA: lipopolysaccharide kinase InaA family protein [Candidatus Binataceae bacterium]|nr:lipopolysaccharide kinase InaA family protein [Candidatus Binataceae bacterium]
MISRRAIERDGWRFVVPGLDTPAAREALIGLALEATAGRGQLVRRTLNAATRVVEFADDSGMRCDAFIKVFDSPHGIGALKRKFRGSRALHLARIETELNANGINAPEVLLVATERIGGREMVVTRRAEGLLAARHMGPYRESLARKRAVLHMLGIAVARMHRAGFVHGDLTPFNVVVAPGAPLRIVFIDHERTSRSRSIRWRPRLRNLVQLGHYDVPGLTNMDRMRVWKSYAAEIGASPAVRRRMLAMLAARVKRDGGLAPAHPTPMVTPAKLQEGNARAS